jgi:hypothetical protein
MVQGDSTIFAYCQRLKIKVAALRDVSHPMEDSQLVLALLHGLNPCFSNTADNIANSGILPMFARAHDMLVLKELRLANNEKTITNTSLLTVVGFSCTSLGGCRSTTTSTSDGSSNPHISGYNSSNWKGKGKGKHGLGGGQPCSGAVGTPQQQYQ